MIRIFNERPPNPRYTFIWDVDVVLSFIKSNWGQNSDLSLIDLTYKLTMSFTLITASRVLAIKNLSVEYMTRSKDQYIFHGDKLLKNWRNYQLYPSVNSNALLEDSTLCVVAVSDEYIKRIRTP